MTVRSLAYRMAIGALLAAALAWAPLAWRMAANDDGERTEQADAKALAQATAMQKRIGATFDDLADRIGYLAASPGLSESFRAFEEAFWAIEKEPERGALLLRRHYAQNGPPLNRTLYHAAHEQRSPLLASMTTGIGGADLLLVEPKAGYVVYSTGKGERFATRLAKDDPAAVVAMEAFKSQGGARFSGVVDADGRISDGWFAAPIRHAGVNIGTALVRVPARTLLDPITEIADADPTGWLALFSAEGKLLAHRGTPHSDLIATVADGFAQMSGEAGVHPVEGSFGQWRGVARGLDLAGWSAVGVALAPVESSRETVTLLIGAGLVALVAGGLIGWFLFRSLSGPLSAHVDQISHLTQTGSEPAEGGFHPSGLAPLDDLVGDLARGLVAHRAETEKERSALQAYIDQLESTARVTAMANDGDGGEERRSRRKMTEERAFAETTWPRIKEAMNEATDLLNTLDGESASHAAQMMERATDELSRGFLAMAGPPEISSATFTGVDLAPLVMERAKTASPKAERKEIEILFQRSDDKCVVRGDTAGLTKLVDALIDNALTYTMPEGVVTLRVEKENDVVRLTVADTGLGIAQGEEKKIFERFRRGTAAMATGVPGLGLGLSDAHAIALAHGARMSATNGVEKGAIFRVEFPDGLGPRQPTLPVG